MSYPRDLDEIPEAELERELRRRTSQRLSGLCDYCGRPPLDQYGKPTPACKFPDRHTDQRILE